MITPAKGDADSPIAKRGCRPRSMSVTRYPSRRAIIASIDPPNPEPTMARSVSGVTATHYPIADTLLAIHRCQSCGARGRACARVEPFDVPEIREDPHGRSERAGPTFLRTGPTR